MRKLWRLFLDEPAFTLGIVIAVCAVAGAPAVALYVAAAATAALRFIVSPAK